MGGKIFINYRRGDDAGNTGRLFDQLQQTFGKDRLFLDVDSIAPGLNFVEVLEAQIRQCDVLIAVIGPRWLDATAPNGNRRLDDPDDFVRVEIAAALNQGKRVIPVLVGGAQMPREHELPDVLKPLAKRNAARLTHERFRADTEGLVSALQQALGDKSASQKEGPQERAQRNLGGVLVWSLGAGLIGLLAVALIWSWAPLSPLLREPPQEPAALSKECAGCPEMVKVPAGSFTLGSPATEVGRSLDEGPERLITFAQPFEVGRFAVTFDEWDACVAAGGCNAYRPADEGWGRGRRPVILVSWNDTKTYIAWISRKTGNTYRLLTEAEREYVTRAGTTTAFWWGNSISTGQANYNGNQTYGVGPKGEYRQQTLPVDSFQPNPWGFFQVHGNVWEWVEDCYQPSYPPAPLDGSAWVFGDCGRRVVRGGSWGNIPRLLRSASRSRIPIDGRANGIGFRLARTPHP